MDLPPHLSQPSGAGENVSSYHNHGFTLTTPMGAAADTSFFSEQRQQQYDYDKSQSDDHDEEVHQDAEALPEIETAYSEARARGLPDGWTCSIDVCVLYMLPLLSTS
jgi:hypothetical protein